MNFLTSKKLEGNAFLSKRNIFGKVEEVVCTDRMIRHSHQRGGLMDKTFGVSAGRSVVQIPGWGKCSLRTTSVDARVNHPLSRHSLFDVNTTFEGKFRTAYIYPGSVLVNISENLSIHKDGNDTLEHVAIYRDAYLSHLKLVRHFCMETMILWLCE